ncbi:WXG100 family type VII secretion target [Micromonospora rubida]|uniref:WXG100 family type VII secretion target n=1 Tax=Micromonospora rubida TaxID=2697657 RepID=UPI0013780BB4|nr:hypothetical protein [Micromonospora rubida]NBE81431.1 hypothetical protein [Micromonospora rubida]
MFNPGNLLIFAAVKQAVEANAKIAKTAVLALVAVGSMAANPNDMSDAATAWKEMANDLTSFAAHLDGALGKGGDWKADDKDAFAASFTNFKGEILQFKGAVSDIAGTLEVISNTYMVSYVALLAFLLACLAILIGLLALLVIPLTTAPARAAIAQIGLAVTAVSTKVATLLAGLTAAVAAMFGAVAYGWVNIGSRNDSIPAALDFKKIQIDYEAP